jgi:hypothetical protein
MVRRTWLYALALFVIGTGVAFFRLPPGSRNVLWAEDGGVFLSSALAHPPLAGLFVPYAGYMHAFPRLSSWLVVEVVPLRYDPVALTLISCALTSFVGTLVWLLLRPRFQMVLPALALWAAIVSLPIAGGEVNGSIANAHWYLLAGLFVVSVSRQRSAAIIALSCVTAAFGTMSDPLSVVFLPLVLVRLVSAKTRRELWFPIVYILGLAVQLTIALQTHLSAPTSHPTIDQLVRTTGFRVFLAALTGETWSAELYASLGVFILFAATAIVLIPVVWTTVRNSQLGVFAACSVLWAVAFFVLAMWIRWLPSYDPQVNLAWGASRYSVVPVILVLVSLAAAAEAWYRRNGHSPWRWLGHALLVSLVVITAISGLRMTGREVTSSWADNLAFAQSTCEAQPDSTSVRIPIAPSSWELITSCGDITNG